jgi:multimeric flavodoxin WrbA
MTVRVVAINGSPRKNGNTQLMLDSAAKAIRSAGIDVEHISLAKLDIRPCAGCERCNTKPWDCPIKDDAAKVLRKIVAADGVLMGSPVYCGGVTAQMKALFDRSIIVYTAMELKNKVGGALCCGGGQHGGQELTILQIVTFFTMQDMIVANCTGGLFGAMGVGNDRGDVKNDSEGLKSARNLGQRMVELLNSR